MRRPIVPELATTTASAATCWPWRMMALPAATAPTPTAPTVVSTTAASCVFSERLRSEATTRNPATPTAVAAIRAGRLEDKPGQYPRDEHAVKGAGLRAHYAEDNTQLQHATIDYKSAAYFAEKRKARRRKPPPRHNRPRPHQEARLAIEAEEPHTPPSMWRTVAEHEAHINAAELAEMQEVE